MARLTSYYIEMSNGLDSIKYGFNAPSNLYGGIKTDLGVIEATERTYGATIKGLAGRNLPRLRLGLGGRFGNAANTRARKSALVFVDPGQIEHCLDRLIGKSVNGLDVTSVKIPKRRAYV